MRQELIEDREVVTCINYTSCSGRSRLSAKQCAVGFLADADVQPKHSRAIQIRGAIEIAIVFGHDGGKRKLALWLQVAIRVVDKEGIPPRDLRATARFGLDNIDAGK